MKEVKIHQLIDRCIDYFQSNCYTDNRVYKYKKMWKDGILTYLKSQSLEVYTTSIGKKFIDSCHFNETIRPQERDIIRSVQVLNDMLTLGYIRQRCVTHVFHPLEGDVGREMEKLVTHLRNLRRSNNTIKGYRLYLSSFLNSLTTAGIVRVNEISERHILSFISSYPTNKVNIVSALRVLFRFWKQEHIIINGFEELFETYKIKRPERIPSFYATEEIMKIENSISRSSSIGKRDYAMVLLASRLGLRASDIASLQFSNIDWDNNVIKLVMNKDTVPKCV